jgi:hypothetical protein
MGRFDYVEYIVPGSCEPQSSSIWEGGSEAAIAAVLAMQPLVEGLPPGAPPVRYLRLSRRVFDILEPREQDKYIKDVLFKELGSSEKTMSIFNNPDTKAEAIERLTDDDEAAHRRFMLARQVYKAVEQGLAAQ